LRWRGAHVVATVSSDEKAELARVAGAHEVVDYRCGDAAEAIRAAAPAGVDRVVEVAPDANLVGSSRGRRRRRWEQGRLVLIADSPRQRADADSAVSR